MQGFCVGNRNKNLYLNLLKIYLCVVSHKNIWPSSYLVTAMFLYSYVNIFVNKCMTLLVIKVWLLIFQKEQSIGQLWLKITIFEIPMSSYIAQFLNTVSIIWATLNTAIMYFLFKRVFSSQTLTFSCYSRVGRTLQHNIGKGCILSSCLYGITLKIQACFLDVSSLHTDLG